MIIDSLHYVHTTTNPGVLCISFVLHLSHSNPVLSCRSVHVLSSFIIYLIPHHYYALLSYRIPCCLYFYSCFRFAHLPKRNPRSAFAESQDKETKNPNRTLKKKETSRRLPPSLSLSTCFPSSYSIAVVRGSLRSLRSPLTASPDQHPHTPSHRVPRTSQTQTAPLAPLPPAPPSQPHSSPSHSQNHG